MRPMPAFLLLALGALVVGVGLWHWAGLPIYPDEITYHAYASRLFVDGLLRQSLYSFCENANAYPIPLPFYPAALFHALLGLMDNHVAYRMAGIGLCLLAFGLIQAALIFDLSKFRAFGDISRRAARRGTQRHFYKSFFSAVGLVFSGMAQQQEKTRRATSVFPLFLFALVCAVFAGVLPSAAFMLRVESFLLVLLAGASMLALRIEKEPLHPAAMAAGLFLLYLFFTASLYIHPKAAFFLPGLLVLAACCDKKSRGMAALFAAACLAATLTGAPMLGTQLLTCPQSPVLEHFVGSASIHPALAFKDPPAFFAALADNLHSRDWSAFLRKVTFAPHSDIDYLPPVAPSTATRIVNALVMLSAALTYTAGLAFLVLLAMQVIKIFRAQGRAGAPALVLLALLGGVLVQILLNRHTTFYDVGFWLCAILLLTGPALMTLQATSLQPDKPAPAITVLAVLFALIHGAAALASLPLMHHTLYAAYRNGLPQGRMALWGYDADAQRQGVQQALAACGLKETDAGLVYDDYTYPFVKNAPHAHSATWLLFAAGTDGVQARAFLERTGSSGVVALCPLVEKFARSGETLPARGALCCLRIGKSLP